MYPNEEWRRNTVEQFLRDIIEYFRDPENVRRYEEWLAQQADGADS